MNPSVRICIAPRAQPFDESMDSLNQAVQYACDSGMGVSLAKIRGGVPGFQNYGPVMADFLESQDTHMFVAADDVLYPKETIVRLVGHDKDVVSAIYRKNLLREVQPANFGDGTVETFLKHLEEGGVYETKFGSAHSMTIRRGVLEKMIEDYPELGYEHLGRMNYALFLPMVLDGKVYQDDSAFSWRANRSGFTLWDDFGCHLRHFCGDFLGFEAVLGAEKPAGAG